MKAAVKCIDGDTQVLVHEAAEEGRECDLRHMGVTRSDIYALNRERANPGRPHKKRRVVDGKEIKDIEGALSFGGGGPRTRVCEVKCVDGVASYRTLLHLPREGPVDVSHLGITLKDVSRVLYHDAIGSPPPLDENSDLVRQELGWSDVDYVEEAHKSMKARNIERLSQNPRVFLDTTEGMTFRSYPPSHSTEYTVWLFTGPGEARRDQSEEIGTFTLWYEDEKD